MFRESDAMVISKVDLLPHLSVDMEAVKKNALSVNPSLEVFPLSAETGEGVPDWLEWFGEGVEGAGS